MKRRGILGLFAAAPVAAAAASSGAVPSLLAGTKGPVASAEVWDGLYYIAPKESPFLKLLAPRPKFADFEWITDELHNGESRWPHD